MNKKNVVRMIKSCHSSRICVLVLLFVFLDAKQITLGVEYNASAHFLKDKSGLDKIIVKKQPYQLLNTNREFFPSFDASNFLKLVNEST